MGGAEAESWAWPDALDALVAAGNCHRLVFENDDVRVLDTRIAPGETTPVHTHRWPAILYMLTVDHFVRRDGAGATLVDTRTSGMLPAPGAAIPTDALPPHTVENVGSFEIRFINIELKHR